MTEHVSIEMVPILEDPRGSLLEPLTPEQLKSQRNVHLVLIEPGAIRGNHYHLKGEEVFTVIGPALVRTRRGTVVKDTSVPERQAYRFTIPPGVAHAIQNTGTKPVVLVAFNTEVHDPQHPDVVPDKLLTRE